MIAKREEALDYIVPPPHMLSGINPEAAAMRHEAGVFPELNGDILGRALLPSPQRSPWKQRHRILRPTEEPDVCFFIFYLLCFYEISSSSCVERGNAL